MSPSESDLRAALRHGEGDVPNVDVVIAGAREARAQRRGRLLSVAAVTVLVAGAATGGAVLFGGSGSNDVDHGGGMRAPGATPSPPEVSSTASGAAGGAGGTAATGSAPACPTSLPRYLLPGGGSPGQFGSTGPLFSKPVATVVVCGYGAEAQAVGHNPSIPARLVLTGARATQLADSLENAPTQLAHVNCPDIVAGDARALAMIGVAADGSEVGTVTANLTQPACNVRVTNGTAVRYNWQPPASIQPVLITLTPQLPHSLSPGPGKSTMNGSPIHT
jgi:hypothetical protein